MKNTLKRCISALLAAGTLLALAAPTAMAEDERRTPSGIKFADLEKKFDDEFNFDKYATDPVEYYAGFEAVVFCGDEIVYEGYFGETDRERHIPCGEDSVFEWGSISKTMTWVSAMQLWEQGRLDLDADIRDYLPDGFLRYLRYDEPITMQNLMDHTGGWCETTYNISTTDSSKLTTLAEALQETEPAQINHPGEVVSYSNWGAALAAYVVECVSGMDYTDYVHENIFDRLGMEHTSIAADFSDNEWVREQRDNLCSYTFNVLPPKYKSDGKRISYIKLYPCGSAAGTIRDLATYAQAFVSNDAPLFEHRQTQEKLFSGSLFYGNTDIPLSSYGFGVTEYKVRTFGHDGATVACRSNMIFDRESKVGMVTLTNETSTNLVIEGIPKMIFGSCDLEKYSDGSSEERSFDGYYLISRSNRGGLLRFTSCLTPVCADRQPDLVRVNDGLYTIGGELMLGEGRRSDGRESFMLGAMEIDRDKAYPAEISLLALYFIIAIGSVFVLMYKVKAARRGRYSLTAVGAAQTAGQLIKLISAAAAIVLIAYVGREASHGVPKAVGVVDGIVNLVCIAVCAGAATASLIGIVSKKSDKWAKLRGAVNIAANAAVIAAVLYFEMYRFWGC